MVLSLHGIKGTGVHCSPLLVRTKEIIKVMIQAIENMKKGYPAGNDLVKEILSLKVVSKYKMAKDLGVNRQTVYNWIYNHTHPDEKNYMRLKDYRLYVNKLLMIGVFR